MNYEPTKNKKAQVPEGLPMSTQRLFLRRKRMESKREREREREREARCISFLLNCEHTKNKYVQVPEGLPMSTQPLF